MNPPEFGIPLSELTKNEFMGSYYVPNWIRPLPKEEQPTLDDNSNMECEPFIDEMDVSTFLKSPKKDISSLSSHLLFFYF